MREKCEVVLLLITYRPHYRGGESLEMRRVNWGAVAEVFPRQQGLIYATRMPNFWDFSKKKKGFLRIRDHPGDA